MGCSHGEPSPGGTPAEPFVWAHGWLAVCPCAPLGVQREGTGAATAPGSVFCSDLSNNRISSLSNSSFTNMSQLTTL